MTPTCGPLRFSQRLSYIAWDCRPVTSCAASPLTRLWANVYDRWRWRLIPCGGGQSGGGKSATFDNTEEFMKTTEVSAESRVFYLCEMAEAFAMLDHALIDRGVAADFWVNPIGYAAMSRPSGPPIGEDVDQIARVHDAVA